MPSGESVVSMCMVRARERAAPPATRATRTSAMMPTGTTPNPKATPAITTRAAYNNHMAEHVPATLGAKRSPRGVYCALMALLDMSAKEEGDLTVLSLTGELDISSAGRVEKEIARAEERQPGALILDLSALEFMDSTGLRIVVSADARARERGGRFAVVRGPDAVQRIFRITRLDERLEILDSAEQVG